MMPVPIPGYGMVLPIPGVPLQSVYGQAQGYGQQSGIYGQSHQPPSGQAPDPYSRYQGNGRYGGQWQGY
jgi:hypothetical protein